MEKIEESVEESVDFTQPKFLEETVPIVNSTIVMLILVVFMMHTTPIVSVTDLGLKENRGIRRMLDSIVPLLGCQGYVIDCGARLY